MAIGTREGRSRLEVVRLVLENLIFTVVVPGTVAILIPRAILGRQADPSWDVGAWRLSGIGAMALGALIYFRCLWDFTWTGRGTPTPIDATRALVATGLYRWVRNPMYIGVGLVILGQAILFQSLALLGYALLAFVVWHLVVLLYEEPSLKARFGASYEDYLRTVPRWIPRKPRA